MVRPLRSEMDEIFDWLTPQITAEDKKWLDEEWPGLFKGKTIEEAIKKLRQEDQVIEGIIIRSVLDAKRGKRADYPDIIFGISAGDLAQIAKMLEIEIPKERNQMKLLNIILEKIRKLKNKKCD